MRLLIIRHGDPDYKRDSLTQKGRREAELLAGRLVKEGISYFYVSPLGRAQDTAAPTLEKVGRTAMEYKWLREFHAPITRPDRGEGSIVWDWLPSDWTKREGFFRRDLWYMEQELLDGHVKEEYDWVVTGFDTLLAEHGYVRDGDVYRVEHPNSETLAFFCHLGVECVLLSHLMNVSPMILWHHTFIAPASVTAVYTEERRRGIADFRVQSLGDLSHLYAAGEAPSTSGKFCETYDSPGGRRD